MGSLDGDLAVTVIRDLMIPMPDGVRLAANLFIPEGGGPYPGIFTFHPYHKDGHLGLTHAPINRHFASRGYAVMEVDFRGVGGSEGVNPYPFDPQERGDGHHVVEWMAAQPWCTGSVGIWGASYGGITALSIASTHPPHLKAIVPIHATVDNYEWFLRVHGCQGLMYCEVEWASRMAAGNLAPPLRQDGEGRWLERWRERLEANEPWILSWHGTPPDPAFWLRRRIPYERIEVPTFGICGWYDAYTAPTFMVFEAVRAPKRVLIGPWKHALPDFSPVSPVGAFAEMDRWWDRWLKGIRNGVDEGPPVAIYVVGAERWRHETTWPPSRTTTRRLFLDADRRLTDDGPPASPGADDYAYDARVGSGSIEWHSGLPSLPLPGDQGFDDHLSLAYTSDPLPEAIEVTGTPVVRVFVSATAPETNLAVKLCVVDPEGRSVVLAQGWANPARADAHAPREPLAAGEAREVVVPLHPTSRVIAAGHRLRLCLAGADFPEIWPTPHPYTLSVHRGGDRPSCVEVPIVVSADEALPEPRFGPARTDLAPPAEARKHESHAVTRDLLGRRLSYETTSLHEHRVDADTRLVTSHHAGATTDAARPWATSLRTETAVEHRRPIGTVVTRAELLVTPFGVQVSAEVEVDGKPFYQRRWTKDVDEWLPSASSRATGDVADPLPARTGGS
jgi:putative CocE/NonD family hydrolase